jgi:hypothetical protein
MRIKLLSRILLGVGQAEISYAIFNAVRRQSALKRSVSFLTIGCRRVAR